MNAEVLVRWLEGGGGTHALHWQTAPECGVDGVEVHFLNSPAVRSIAV